MTLLAATWLKPRDEYVAVRRVAHREPAELPPQAHEAMIWSEGALRWALAHATQVGEQQQPGLRAATGRRC
ncbi:hypothetical protein [Pseudonocardia broussonetiae]|uniref:Uncharacterized protein n=1 Tax=Pseudonocardia broussonetiae TaxID=2736640 RepID=A0A6M6JIB5_9PSEU|nr:hypothetical protein [Pseudonocardia broussonetiae]QJY47768.1 hypothetical protein HOP40_19740 [Pseudonocardia broussonetiae]